MEKLQKAILKTLSYADVFDYPLTLAELRRWLITNSKLKIQNSNLSREARSYSAGQLKIQNLIHEGKVQEFAGFYFPKNRKEIIDLRKKREKWSQVKLKIALKVARWLKLIPFIKMVAVTGNLAMNNSDKEDDIDLLIIASENRLWLTRFLTVLLVELVARRRRPGDKDVEDKICLNMFLDEDHLEIPEKEQDLFSAHEVCQLKPIWSKDNVYQEFITQNQWYQKFLPNWKP